MSHLHYIEGDITKLAVDAIINAANEHLTPGAGVSGQIHRAGGYELTRACQELKGCEIGQAKLTRGFLLPAMYVIHTVGPVWQGGNHDEEELLASCYTSCLEIAMHLTDVQTIAFPAISAGIFGYPLKSAIEVGTQAVHNFLQNNITTFEIYFVCFESEMKSVYQEVMAQY